jgi:hypothetical protein
VTWTFDLHEEGYAIFQKAHAAMRVKDHRTPASEEDFGGALLGTGLQVVVARLAQEERQTSRIWTPEAAAVADRLTEVPG